MASTGGSRGESKSPKQSNNASPPQPESASDPKQAEGTLKSESSSSSAANKPLAPPPRPGQPADTNTPDYFSNPPGGSLNLEPNPFDQSFGAPAPPPETPGGTKLPPVASLASPSSLLPGSNATPFTWGGGSLRTGPLSPAMLSGPTNDYFSDAHHIRGFPTPNESSMRTGLTPGGGGSMFPASSPGSQAVLAQLASSGATPGTLDFHRTALSAAAAAKREPPSLQPAVTSQPQDMPQAAAPTKPETKAPVGHFDPHDNDAANGLFLLANGRNNSNAQPQTQYTMAPQQQVHAQRGSVSGPQASTSPHVTKSNPSAAARSARGASEAGSAASDESEQARPNTRGKGKRGSNAGAGATNGRRKADDTVAKGPASKKAKTNGGSANSNHGYEDMDMYDDDDDDSKHDEGGSKIKMTDEEKRKNFLERNRVAALKCRQRKKQWLANLQTKVEEYTSVNESLNSQISQLREEVVNLKTLLLAHKDCNISQQQAMRPFMQQPIDSYNPQMHSYGMPAPPLTNPQIMAGQGAQRPYS